MSAIGLGSLILIVWLLLWDTLQVANVLSGILVALVVLKVVPGPRFEVRSPVIRPIATLRFLSRVAIDLVRAHLTVAREIVSKESSVNTAVVAVPLPDTSPGLLTVVASVLSLSPGTMPIEVIDEPGTIYIHVLKLLDIEAKRREVQHLTALAVRAFGTAEAVAALSSQAGRTIREPQP